MNDTATDLPRLLAPRELHDALASAIEGMNHLAWVWIGGMDSPDGRLSAARNLLEATTIPGVVLDHTRPNQHGNATQVPNPAGLRLEWSQAIRDYGLEADDHGAGVWAAFDAALATSVARLVSPATVPGHWDSFRDDFEAASSQLG